MPVFHCFNGQPEAVRGRKAEAEAERQKQCFISNTVILGMAVKGQENPGKKGLLQGMGKVWKFHFEFRENLHL